MSNYYKLLTLVFISFVFFTNDVSAQNTFSQKVQKHILRYQADSLLPETSMQQLQQLQEWLNNNKQVPQEYILLLDNYLSYLSTQSYKSYTAATHEDIISQALNILMASNTPSTDMKSWSYSLLPEYYIAAKTLLPDSISKNATMEMAKERPQELIGQFSKLPYAQSAEDLEVAILSSPHSVTQFLHYNNRVKSELEKSDHPDIQLLFEIYQKHRYTSSPYYLLPYITQGDMTAQQAIAIAQDETSFIKHLLPLVIEENDLAFTSIQQKWSETMDKYVRKIKRLRFRQPASWGMEALDSLPIEDLTKILFTSSDLLNKQELAAFIQWVHLKNDSIPIDIELLESIPLSYLIGQYQRIKHEKMEDDWKQLLTVQQLESFIIHQQEALATAGRDNNKDAPAFTQIESKNPLSINSTNTNKNMQLVDIAPKYILKKYYFNLSHQQKAFIKWKNDPLTALKELDKWIDESYSKDLLIFISERHPLELVKKINEIKLKKTGVYALKNIAKTAPLSAKNYIISATHPWNYLFKNSQDSIIRTLYKINKEAGVYTRAYLLLDDIYHHKISIQEADAICKDYSSLTRKMIQLLAKPNVLGKYSLEQEVSARSLKFVRNLNISINTNGSFSDKLYELSPEEIYTFMTYGEDEIIQRSFESMLNHLMNRVPGRNLYSLMERLGFNKYSELLQKAAYYDLLDGILEPLSHSQKSNLVHHLLEDLEHKEINDAIQVASFIISLNNSEIIDMIHDKLKVEYERVESKKIDKGVAYYGILSALLSNKTQLNAWARYAAERYELPDFEFLPVYSLFNNQMTNIQQYYFYNDADGIGSFINFIRSYERSPLEWSIKDLGKFVMIESRTGRKVQIYANKARDGEQGIKDMLDYMSQNQLEPQVVVHRGLSTHTLRTFTRIPSSAKLILDGSCGGYYVQQVAIDRAPNAQILCNRNVGTMHINDPLFKQISDEIRSGKDIIWPELWSKMQRRVGTNPYFKDYIPPHKNAATILIKTVYELLEIK